MSEIDNLLEAMENHPAGKGLPEMTINQFILSEDFEDKVLHVAHTDVAVLLRKHRQYGPKNIANAPGGALNGLLVRAHDKVARLVHLAESGAEPEDEAVIDSWLDLTNYGIIAQLVLRGEWPNG